jgi:hypothetical protein
VDSVALVQVFLPVLPSFPVSVIPPVLLIHSSITDAVLSHVNTVVK